MEWYTLHTTLNSIPSGEGTTISLSRDGNALAVGNLYSENNGGVTTVYKVCPPGCTDNKKLLRISFTTDISPRENRWTLQTGNETIQSQLYDELQKFMTFVKEMCVPADVCVKFRFRVFDTAGDGMLVLRVPGSYSVMLDGVEVANGGADLDYGATKYITGDCNCPAGLSLLTVGAQNSPGSYIPMEWALSHQNSTSAEEYVFIRTMDHEVEIFEECIPEVCWHLTNPKCHGAVTAVYDDDAYSGDWSYNVTYKGWSAAKSGGGNFCPEGDKTISFGECLPGENIAVDYRTASPTTSVSPSSSSSPTCTDTPDWVDGDGDGCDLYKDWDSPGCPEYGSDPDRIGDMVTPV